MKVGSKSDKIVCSQARLQSSLDELSRIWYEEKFWLDNVTHSLSRLIPGSDEALIEWLVHKQVRMIEILKKLKV